MSHCCESWKALSTWKSFGSGKWGCLLPCHLELAFLAEGSNEKESGLVGRRRESPVIKLRPWGGFQPVSPSGKTRVPCPRKSVVVAARGM